MKDTICSIHFVGIKGVGMSALALVAKGLGYKVTGSDVAEEFITDAPLVKAKIKPMVGFAADHVGAPDLVVVGAAYGAENPEVAAAKAKKIPVWTYSELLGHLARQKKTIAVAGTHGKTTTTALLAFLFYHTGQHPSFVIGTGSVEGLPAHGAAGRGDFFIAEADDYQRAPHDRTPKFLDLSPFAAIITGIEHDHPDLYLGTKDVIEAFYNFCLRLSPKGFLVVNADDPNVSQLRSRLADCRFISYGLSAVADYRLKMIRSKVGQPTQFRLVSTKRAHGPFILHLAGQHNLANAAAAITMALELGVKEQAIIKLLPQFKMVERRYQTVGRVGERVVIDDYAHHPTSVRLTLETARQQFPQRPIWVFFQPHTYSRTKALLKEFGGAFTPASQVIITDIFSSARERSVTVTAQDLVKEISQHHKNVLYVPKVSLLSFMKKNLPAAAVVITMGAGDIYKVGREFVERL